MSTITIPSLYPVTCHTDHVGPGSTFVVIQGMKEDGSVYIPRALERGATRIVIQENVELSLELQELLEKKHAELIKVADTRKALALLSAQALNYPARSLRIIAITGTKGKSTTAFLVEHLLKTAGYKTALLTTVKNKILDVEFKTELTTQQPDYLHMFFSVCKQQHIDYVVMEVAAQALTLSRVAGLSFDALLFTNFSAEHAEFYKKIDDYFDAKAALCNYLKAGAPAILNADDTRIWHLGSQLGRVISFGLGQWADVTALVQANNLQGIEAQIVTPTEKFPVTVPALVGTFNVYNILAAVGLVQALGVAINSIQQGLLSFKGVPGRLERFVLRNGAKAFIDFAHNPSSYEAVLSTLRPLSPHLIVVCGAGGDRDATKRPLMGRIAAQFADVVMVTSDNPRSEDPQEIINQVVAGIAARDLPKVHKEIDREIAIKKAYGLSHADSMLVLLGKGPDEYQIIKGVKHPFSESALLKSLQKDAAITTINLF
ncbi:UDP-N-acetylmuramoyl-L-alanyl-D-glutamate--2,6-diaminopimelate ligase [Candidatus Dependentiae bacterium]|nr:UDP-N-acetylmuramoyl-L-alanyl-D-glutamate--2,6-diaminopimelate ligase [Candidatus Dependentiae bacterium]